MKTETSNYPFESFNARALSPKQVAIGFVPPTSFIDLCKRRHTIIAGPRGSGKTTLLKMLQVSALRSWKHFQAEEIRNQIDFTGVFIPTDRCWSEQISSIGKSFLTEDQRRQLGVAAFTTQILRALVSAVLERKSKDVDFAAPTFRAIAISPKQESDLVASVAPLWHFNLEAQTLLSLKIALSQRLSEIHQFASKIEFLEESKRNDSFASENFLHLNFLSSISLFLDVFENVTSSYEEKWALLFDELELAPESIRAALTQALRSVDSRIIFKLSIAPFSRELEENVRAATDKNDFDLIKLWYPAKEEGYPFSRDLMEQILHQRGIRSATLEEVFGTTDFDLPNLKHFDPAERQDYYLLDVFERLASRDQSFKEYLRHRSIDLKKTHLLTPNERAAQLRKIAPLVIARETFRGADSTSETRGLQRSRKAVSLYSGMPALLAICEGNPRWIIGLIDSLLDRRKNGYVEKKHQTIQILSLQSRFCAFLRTIPCNGFGKNPRTSSVLSLVDEIGGRFSKEIVQDRFNPDPTGSFFVDSHATDDQIKTLEQAIYAGAIVFVPESSNEVAVGSLRGKRFRLSYLLAPKYKLPMILLRPKSLSALLMESPTQVGLFT